MVKSSILKAFLAAVYRKDKSGKSLNITIDDRTPVVSLVDFVNYIVRYKAAADAGHLKKWAEIEYFKAHGIRAFEQVEGGVRIEENPYRYVARKVCFLNLLCRKTIGQKLFEDYIDLNNGLDCEVVADSFCSAVKEIIEAAKADLAAQG